MKPYTTLNDPRSLSFVSLVYDAEVEAVLLHDLCVLIDHSRNCRCSFDRRDQVISTLEDRQKQRLE